MEMFLNVNESVTSDVCRGLYYLCRFSGPVVGTFALGMEIRF